MRKPSWPLTLNRACPQSQGLIGWWPAVQGTRALDLSGRGRHATLVNSAAVAYGLEGSTAMKFVGDAVGGTAKATTSLNLSGMTTVTIAAWMRRDSGSSHTGIAEGDDGSNRVGMMLRYDDAWVNVSNAGSNSANASWTPDTNWHHVALVFDGTQTGDSNRLKMYIDGVLRTLSFGGSTPASLPTFTNNIAIGTWFGGAEGYSDGLIDDARVYSRALNAAEISQLYAFPSRWLLRQRTRLPILGQATSDNSGTMAAVESGPDVFVGSGTANNSGTMAATETGPDVFVGSGTANNSGTMAAVESGPDVFVGSGTANNSGTMAAVESGPDVFVGSGSGPPPPPNIGFMAAVESGSDTFKTGIGDIRIEAAHCLASTVRNLIVQYGGFRENQVWNTFDERPHPEAGELFIAVYPTTLAPGEELVEALDVMMGVSIAITQRTGKIPFDRTYEYVYTKEGCITIAMAIIRLLRKYRCEMITVANSCLNARGISGRFIEPLRLANSTLQVVEKDWRHFTACAPKTSHELIKSTGVMIPIAYRGTRFMESFLS